VGGIFMAWARITTPTVTYVKYRFVVDNSANRQRLCSPRVGTSWQPCSIAKSLVRPPVLPVEGTDEQGNRVVWTADEQGCGCRGGITVVATEPDRVPV